MTEHITADLVLPQIANDASLGVAALAWGQAVPVFQLHGVYQRDDSRWVCDCREGEQCAEENKAGKHPRRSGWREEATQNAERIREWWEERPNSNIGMPTGAASGIVALDCDEDEDAETGGVVLGEHELLAWLETNAGLGATLDPWPAHGTPSGGLHVLTPLNGAGPVASGGRILPAVDRKGDDGLIVLPPSIGRGGRRYRQLRSGLVAPAGRLAYLQTLKGGRSGPSGSPGGPNYRPDYDYRAAKDAGPQEGHRDQFFNDRAYELRKHGTSRQDAEAELRRMWERCPNGVTNRAGKPFRWETALEKIQRIWRDVEPDPKWSSDAWYVRWSRGEGSQATGQEGATSADGQDYDIRRLPQYAKVYEHRKVWHRADRDARGVIDAEDSAEDRPEPSNLKTGAALLAEPEPEYDWIVRDLLERGDRAIITGSEGVGKTMLAAQIPVQASEGIHPITLQEMTRVRSLLVDVEIGEREMRRRLRRYSGAHAALENIVVECRGSLDLRRDAHVAWLVETAKSSEAQVVWIGPLYRLASGDPIEETHARAVQSGLEALRELGIAVLLEAHCPHGMPDGGRPYGASAWKRWPEFGYCLRASGRFTAWRPPRDSERLWPEAFRRGHDREWPWVAQAGALAAEAREFQGGVDEVARLVNAWFEEEGDGMPLPELRETLNCRAEERTNIIQTAINDELIREEQGTNPRTGRRCRVYVPVG